MTAFATPDISTIEDVDPRNPYVRLATLLDDGTVSPLQAADAPDTYDRAGVVEIDQRRHCPHDLGTFPYVTDSKCLHTHL